MEATELELVVVMVPVLVDHGVELHQPVNVSIIVVPLIYNVHTYIIINMLSFQQNLLHRLVFIPFLFLL